MSSTYWFNKPQRVAVQWASNREGVEAVQSWLAQAAVRDVEADESEAVEACFVLTKDEDSYAAAALCRTVDRWLLVERLFFSSANEFVRTQFMAALVSRSRELECVGVVIVRCAPLGRTDAAAAGFQPLVAGLGSDAIAPILWRRTGPEPRTPLSAHLLRGTELIMGAAGAVALPQLLGRAVPEDPFQQELTEEVIVAVAFVCVAVVWRFDLRLVALRVTLLSGVLYGLGFTLLGGSPMPWTERVLTASTFALANAWVVVRLMTIRARERDIAHRNLLRGHTEILRDGMARLAWFTVEAWTAVWSSGYLLCRAVGVWRGASAVLAVLLIAAVHQMVMRLVVRRDRRED